MLIVGAVLCGMRFPEKRSDVAFQEFEWHGVVDFGEEIESSVKKGIATQALVLMFRPYKGSWVQPFGCFASLNAASCTILHEVILKATVLLFNHKAIVKNFVCDGLL